MPVTARIGAALLSIGQGNKEATLNSALNTLDTNALFMGIINSGNLGLGIAPTHRFHALDGITETWLTNTGNAASGLKGWHINKTDKTSATSHGISYDVEGTVVAESGVDFSTNVASKFGDFIPYFDPSFISNETQIVTVGTNTAGQFRLTFNTHQTADIAFGATAATVRTALEALTGVGAGQVAVVGNAGGPWEVTFTGTLGGAAQPLMTLQNGTTPLSGGSGQGVTGSVGGSTGADILRFSPYALGTGTQTTKVNIAAPSGSPAANTEFLKVVAPKALSGMSVSFNDDAGNLNGFNFTNRTVLHNRCMANFQNLWLFGPDYQHTGSRAWYQVDNIAGLTRLYLGPKGSGNAADTAGLTNAAGVNTAAPLAYWHVQGSNDLTLYDKVQTLLFAGYSTAANRAMLLQTILDASAVVNYAMLRGGLGSTATRATPVLTSTFTTAHGIESTDTVMSLISAPSGSNQTISRVVSVGNNTFGMFGAAPVAKAISTADLRQMWIDYGALTAGGANPLNTNGGAITAGQILGTLFGGVTGPVKLYSTLVTYTSDANLTLIGADLSSSYIDIQTDAVLTTTRNLVVPLGIGNLWIVRNRNAQSIQVIGSSGTGATVPSGKIALLAGSGSNVIFVAQPVTPTTGVP